jgi:hypothetical protein
MIRVGFKYLPVKVIFNHTGQSVTYFLKAGNELNERNNRKLVSTVANARYWGKEYLTSFADFPVQYRVGWNYIRKECD